MLPVEEYKACILKCAQEIHDETQLHGGVFLIAGASGLIGSVTVDCILAMNDVFGSGFRVIALAKNPQRASEPFHAYLGREDFRFVPCDVNDGIPEVGAVDYIVHGASNTHPVAYGKDPIGTIKTNIIGTDHLLAYGTTHSIRRFAFLSSVEIYGEAREETMRFRESDLGYLDCNQARAGYPESKRVGESLCRAYESSHGLDVVIPRLCRVYGPTMRQDDSKALAQFIRKAVNGEDIALKSKGRQFYSYIHVADAVKAVFCILDRGETGQAYNVSSEKSDVTLAELAEKLARQAGTRVVFEVPDETERRGYSAATRAVLDNGKLKALHWKESYDLDGGLEMTVRILKKLKQKQGMQS